jgi:hypothetical protein
MSFSIRDVVGSPFAHIADDPRWIADDHCKIGHVARHDGAGADKRSSADRLGKQHDTAANDRPLFDQRAR